jgi:hypothetical protein
LVAPFTERVSERDSLSVACDSTSRIGGHQVELRCALYPAHDERDFTKGVQVVVSVDGGPAIAVDRHEGYWDFIHIWARANQDALDLTIDYGVLD